MAVKFNFLGSWATDRQRVLHSAGHRSIEIRASSNEQRISPFNHSPRGAPFKPLPYPCSDGLLGTLSKRICNGTLGSICRRAGSICSGLPVCTGMTGIPTQGKFLLISPDAKKPDQVRSVRL